MELSYSTRYVMSNAVLC